jgi:hypothetical protein
MAWHVGQQAVIDRCQVVTVDRVTPSGQVVVGRRKFNATGLERGVSRSSMARLEPMTPEIRAEMDLVGRWLLASRAAFAETAKAESWMRQSFRSWGPHVPKLADVEKAEALAAAIRSVMGDVS